MGSLKFVFEMKLGSYFVLLAGVAKAANFAKCPAIEAVDNEKKAGPTCEDDMCQRQCKNGFEPAEPTQVFCIKKTNGKFKWDGELGGCQAAGSTDDKPTDEKPVEDGDYGDKPDGEWDGDWGDKPDGDYGDWGDKPDGDWGDYGDKPDGDNGDEPDGDYGDKPDGDWGDYGDKPNGDKPEEEKPEPVDFASLTDNPGCKEVELKNGQVKKGMTVSYKLNGKGQFMATLACQEGQTVNGKEGVDKKKLFCKCNKKSGKCKWKNEANKKVSKAKYQKWKCEGDAVEKPTDEKPTGGGGSTGGGSEVIPPADGRPRILALHGGGGDGAGFSMDQGVRHLMDAVGDNFEFVFASAPQNGLWMRDPPGKDQPTNDPAWADVALNYLDDFIAQNGPFYAMLGYSQGSAIIPVYLSNRPEMQDQFDRVMMYCGYTPTTHLGLMETLNANAPLSTTAMVFSGVHDPFAFGAPDQVAVFTDVVHYESSEAGHHLPMRNDPEFQNTVDFIMAGL